MANAQVSEQFRDVKGLHSFLRFHEKNVLTPPENPGILDAENALQALNLML